MDLRKTPTPDLVRALRGLSSPDEREPIIAELQERDRERRPCVAEADPWSLDREGNPRVVNRSIRVTYDHIRP